ncbi:MAG: proton-conducting transporter membrane subunit [Armatimonadia bacterium]
MTGLGALLLLLTAVLGGNARFDLPLPWSLADARLSLLADPLSRWFLAIIALIGLPVVLFSSGYLHHLRSRVSLGLVWSGLALLLASMAGVVLAANALTFLVAWELMALSSYALVASDNHQRSIRQAAFTYLGATRIGTTALMAGFLWAHQLTGSWTFADWHLQGPSALGPGLLILAGLAVKAGCWPFHLWLPIAHPAAPAPVSAIMSGVMIKTAIYAMARFFIVGGHLSAPALGPTILLLGAISAPWGVLFALLQHDLKRLLAYHSVENIGIILMGLGVSLLGVQWHSPLLAQLGLAAALFHTLNHAVFKSLLFLSTGAVDAQTHLRDIERLGGLIKRMPWTAGAFIVGSAAICALPPLNGFASEWLLYQGFFGLAAGGPDVASRLGGLLLMGWLGLVGALAIACFAKAVGIVFLGLPRSTEAEQAHEVTPAMVAAQAFLGLLCLALGLAVPALLGPLGRIAAPLGPSGPLQTAWTLPVGLLALVLVLTLSALAGWMLLLARRHPARTFITWECGFGPLGPRTQYTATSFAQPISRLFGAIYNYAVEISRAGRQRRHFPDSVAVETVHEAYLETRLYAPLLRALRHASGVFLMRLQAGSIHQYLIYMALLLMLLLWVGCR